MKTLKALSLATVATLAAAGGAAADSYFGLKGDIDGRSVLELGVVRADAPAVVEIYDYRTGTAGELLGTAEVAAGANADVRIDLGNWIEGDVLAVLKSGDEVLTSYEYDFNRF